MDVALGQLHDLNSCFVSEGIPRNLLDAASSLADEIRV